MIESRDMRDVEPAARAAMTRAYLRRSNCSASGFATLDVSP
jgi:hypothetical protein